MNGLKKKFAIILIKKSDQDAFASETEMDTLNTYEKNHPKQDWISEG